MLQHQKDMLQWSWAVPVNGGDSGVSKVTNHAEVKEWLEKEGLGQYAGHFQNNNISGAEVPFLTDTHLKQIGVEKVGHRIRLVKSAKNFKRTLDNWQRNEILMEVRNWYLRPRCCVLFPTRFKLTQVAILIMDPEPLECGYSLDRVDVSNIVDVNMKEWFDFLGIVTILSTDPKHPKVRIVLKVDVAREVFLIVKNLWEEDQLKIGKRVG